MNLEEIMGHMQERNFAANGVFKGQLADETLAQAKERVLRQLADDVPDLVGELQRTLLQLSEAKDALAAEVLRIRMLNKVHEVALKQNTAMLELADHYTGSLWPEEVQRAAKEILKAAKEATSEKRNDETTTPAKGNVIGQPGETSPGQPSHECYGVRYCMVCKVRL